MSEFTKDILQGMREGPLVFFAPLIAIWRLFRTTTEQLLRESAEKQQCHPRSGR